MIRESLLEVASSFGVAQEILYVYDQFMQVPGSTIDFDVSIEYEKVADPKGFILFPYMHNKMHAYKYSILGKAFERRGYQPLFVICDVPPTLSNITYANDKWYNSMFEYQTYVTKKVLKNFNCDFINLSDYIGGDKDIEEIDLQNIDTDDYKQIDLNDLSKGSTRKALKKYSLSGTDAKEFRKKFVRGGIILVDAFEEIIDSYDIISVISHDDKYNLGGIPLRVANNKGVNAYSSMLGWVNGSLVISKISDGDSLPHFEQTSTINMFLDEPLNPMQDKKVDRAMKNRANDTDEVRAQFSANSSRSTPVSDDNFSIGMFTNLIWDANLETHGGAFSDPFSWISKSIEIVSQSEDIEMIIKTHPAEKVKGTNQSVSKWISDKYPELPDNIILLDPTTDIDTYRLMQQLDAGTVYNSTTGIEMVYFGVPVVTAGQAPYQDLKITFDPESRSEYISQIENIKNIKLSDRREIRGRRYLYFFFEGKHLDFPFVRTTNGQYDFPSVDDAGIDTNRPDINQMVRRISKGQPVLSPELDWLVDGN
jgi:hypothetical protein